LEIEEIKKQIDIAIKAVKGLEEPFRTKAFEVILAKLIELPIQAKVKESQKPLEEVITEPPPPQISGAKTCREAIIKLLASDWGKKPRTWREIRDAMKLSAVYYQDAVILTELRRMTRLGILRRLKSEDKKGFAYVIGRPM